MSPYHSKRHVSPSYVGLLVKIFYYGMLAYILVWYQEYTLLRRTVVFFFVSQAAMVKIVKVHQKDMGEV